MAHLGFCSRTQQQTNGQCNGVLGTRGPKVCCLSCGAEYPDHPYQQEINRAVEEDAKRRAEHEQLVREADERQRRIVAAQKPGPPAEHWSLLEGRQMFRPGCEPPQAESAVAVAEPKAKRR